MHHPPFFVFICSRGMNRRYYHIMLGRRASLCLLLQEYLPWQAGLSLLVHFLWQAGLLGLLPLLRQVLDAPLLRRQQNAGSFCISTL